LFCAVNFLAGNEQDYQPTPVENPKNVAIVGGGPAGMEAARIATLKGHKVTLYAKEGLGGRLVEAGAPEFKSDIKQLIKYFTAQLEKLNIKVIKEEATAEKLLQGNFDAIIIATGSKLNMHSIPGIDKPIATDVLKVLKGEKVGDQVIVAGAGVIGCEVAIYLAKQGKKVVMTTRRKNFQALASDATFSELPFIMENLQGLGIDLRLGLQIKEVTDKGIIAVDEKEEKHEIPAESVVFSPGFIPDRSLAIELERHGSDVCLVGDCVEPRKISDAVREGYLVGFNL
jgi:2-enoate reductase